VSVLVSVGWGFRCAAVHEGAEWKDGKRLENHGDCNVLRFRAFWCNPLKTDFESAASASSAIPAWMEVSEFQSN
jgi:hypothetical protein